MQIGHGVDIHDATGEPLATSEQEVYLGSLLSCYGRASPSINRRLGEARASFLKVDRIWKHANITKHRKIEIYMSCVVSKLLYSLDCETLRQCDRQRIDAFHCRCLRTICKIPHSMLSHVSNLRVLETAQLQSLSSILANRQLILFGRIAALPSSSFLRSVLFTGSTIIPKTLDGLRKRGRPRISWASVQHVKALDLFSGLQAALNDFFTSHNNADKRWQGLVKGSL